jgi:GNAT superfamily N-acetyltransferase
MLQVRRAMQNMNDVRIRPAASGDLDRVAEVWHESARRMDGADAHMPSIAALRRRVDRELEAGWQLHVATAADEIVAMLAVRPAESVLHQLFVLPSAQGKGVGRALLEVARREMPGGFTLRAATANVRARRFYERAGLRLLGEGVRPDDGRPVCFYGWSP